MPAPLISVFPKCWFDDFVRFERDYVEWIHQAKSLGADGAFAGMPKGAVFVDHTTASAEIARELYDAAKKRGLSLRAVSPWIMMFLITFSVCALKAFQT